MATSVLLRMLGYLRRSFNKCMPIILQDDLQRQDGAVQRCVCKGEGELFSLEYFEILSFCHRMISDPNQSPLDISSDVLLKIILSPGHREKGTRQTMMLHLRYCIFTIPVHVNLKIGTFFSALF